LHPNDVLLDGTRQRVLCYHTFMAKRKSKDTSPKDVLKDIYISGKSVVNTVNEFSRQLTGAASVDRFIDNPSKKTAAKAALDVGAFVAPGAVLAKGLSKAASAGAAAQSLVRASRAPAEQAARLGQGVVKTLKLGEAGGVLKAGGKNVGTFLGESVSTVTKKSLPGVLGATTRMAGAAGSGAYKAGVSAATNLSKGLGIGALYNAASNMLNSNSAPKKTQSNYVQYTGVPQDKGKKNKPGYSSNYQSTPSPSKPTYQTTPRRVVPKGYVPPTPRKKKNNGRGGSGSTAE
jgi:hypothetical protein